MTRDQLKPGIHKVRINDGAGATEFNLSVVEVYGLIGVAGFKDGEKVPRRGEHLSPSYLVNNWINKMEIIGF